MPTAFEFDVVVRGEAVKADNFMTLVEKAASKVKSDKTRRACHKNSHGAFSFVDLDRKIWAIIYLT